MFERPSFRPKVLPGLFALVAGACALSPLMAKLTLDLDPLRKASPGTTVTLQLEGASPTSTPDWTVELDE